MDPGGPALPRAGLPLGGLCPAQRGGDGGRHWHSQPGPPSSGGHGEGKARPLARLVGGGERAAVCLRQLGRERSRRRVRGPGRHRGSRHRVEAGYARREVQPGDGQPGAGHRRADVRAGGPPHRREAGPHPQARPSPTRSPASRRPPCAARRRRGPHDAAITGVLLDTGARVEKCARLDAEDFAITARTGKVRLHGKGDQVRSVPPGQARPGTGLGMAGRARPAALALVAGGNLPAALAYCVLGGISEPCLPAGHLHQPARRLPWPKPWVTFAARVAVSPTPRSHRARAGTGSYGAPSQASPSNRHRSVRPP